MSAKARGAATVEDLFAREAAAQETMAFLLRLRARGVSDVAVLRALETVPRLAFVPHRYADLALRDMALPIPCGQTMSEPFALARVLEALNLDARCRVLEIGAGSGYGAALLAKLAGEVVSYERFRTLALEAGLRLRGLAVANAVAVWGDGLAIGEEAGLFDRILIDGAIAEDCLPRFVERLAEGGVLVAPVLAAAGEPARLTRVAHAGGGFARAEIGRRRALALAPGVSSGL